MAVVKGTIKRLIAAFLVSAFLEMQCYLFASAGSSQHAQYLSQPDDIHATLLALSHRQKGGHQFDAVRQVVNATLAGRIVKK